MAKSTQRRGLLCRFSVYRQSAFVLPLDSATTAAAAAAATGHVRKVQQLLLLRALFCNCRRDCLFGLKTVLLARSQLSIFLSSLCVSLSLSLCEYDLAVSGNVVCCALYACRTQNAERHRWRQRLLQQDASRAAPSANWAGGNSNSNNTRAEGHKSTFGSARLSAQSTTEQFSSVQLVSVRREALDARRTTQLAAEQWLGLPWRAWLPLVRLAFSICPCWQRHRQRQRYPCMVVRISFFCG